MMIRAVAALLLGTLAMAAGNNESLRGNNNKREETNRALQQMGRGMDLGEMACEELGDGSVVCTFRTMPPMDMNTANLHHDCLWSSKQRTNFCLTSEVYRTSFLNVPVDPSNQQAGVVAVNPPLVAVNPSRPVQQQPVQQEPVVSLPFVGRCPSIPQATGMACARYIPQGSREASCYYGRTQCNCATNDDPSVTEGWTCRMVPDDVNFVTNPGTSTNIDANVNQVVDRADLSTPPPTQPPTDSNKGNILPNFVNNPECPATKPNNGVDCSWGRSCSYFTSATTAVDCLCNGSCVFECIPSRHPGLSSF